MSGLLAGKAVIVYGAGGAISGASARVFAREGARVFLAGRTGSKLEVAGRDIAAAGGWAETATLDVFEGFARRIGIPVQEMPAEHARKATLLGRLPKLAEVAEFAAFAASDRAGPMTGTVVNLTCGSMVD